LEEIILTLKSFLKLVEIQTKLASMIPFFLGTLFCVFRYETFKLENFMIMFISLLTFDMATTAINNYYDYKKATNTKDNDYKVKSNVIGSDKLSLAAVKLIIVTLVLIAIVLGAVLTLRTNIFVLLIGLISFGVGIFYTFGPVPLSRMPLGEVFSGFFMGFVIIFLSVYIHVFDKNIVNFIFEGYVIVFSLNIKEMFGILLISIPAIGAIANIMLANNICDMEEDIINKRFTLPYYIGKKNGLLLYKTLYYMGYIAILVSVLLRIAPLLNLLALLTFIPVNKNIKKFYEKQIKSETFVLAVKNFALINGTQIILIGLVNIFNIIF